MRLNVRILKMNIRRVSGLSLRCFFRILREYKDDKRHLEKILFNPSIVVRAAKLKFLTTHQRT